MKKKHESDQSPGLIPRLPNGRYAPLCQRNSQKTRAGALMEELDSQSLKRCEEQSGGRSKQPSFNQPLGLSFPPAPSSVCVALGPAGTQGPPQEGGLAGGTAQQCFLSTCLGPQGKGRRGG